jgi:hypothetical protein
MFIEAVVGFEWVAIIAVSSANVLRRVVEVCGISAVYSVYRKGPRMLPCISLSAAHGFNTKHLF